VLIPNVACLECGTECSTKFCSSKCQGRWKYYNVLRVEKVCGCGVIYWGDRDSPTKCRVCRREEYLPAREGSLNPAWKGGSSQWQPGKHGRDKDGLSWKVQRLLCWERDNYTCQHCDKKQEGWKPDCHHAVPYRISLSHALDNLLSLCRSCHKKAEAQCTELWGGQTLTPPIRESYHIVCICDASSKDRKFEGGRCSVCRRAEQKRLCLDMVALGRSQKLVSQKLGVSKSLVSYWVNGGGGIYT